MTPILQGLLDFIDASPTPYHVVENLIAPLKNKGYECLTLKQPWHLEAGGRYYVERGGSLIAFTLPKDPNTLYETGFRVIASHTDSPSFRVKPISGISESGYYRLNTEMYGGGIALSWFDRPLYLAGRVVLKSEDAFAPLVQPIILDKPLLQIPSVAIHLNPEVNKGLEINRQVDTLPILGLIQESLEANDLLLDSIASQLGVCKTSILDFDLFLSPCEKSCLIGLDEAFISAPRLDNLAMVHASLEGLLQSDEGGARLAVWFNNEETGSLSHQGAASPLLAQVLKRLVSALGGSAEAYYQMVYASFMISADMAHALHPAHPEHHDKTHRPAMNEGVVIKYHANQNYTTDAKSAAVIMQVAERAGVRLQSFANHSNKRSGGTLGSVLMGQIDFESVDLGNAMLGMHASREMAGSKDHEHAVQLFKTFYSL